MIVWLVLALGLLAVVTNAAGLLWLTIESKRRDRS